MRLQLVQSALALQAKMLQSAKREFSGLKAELGHINFTCHQPRE